MFDPFVRIVDPGTYFRPLPSQKMLLKPRFFQHFRLLDIFWIFQVSPTLLFRFSEIMLPAHVGSTILEIGTQQLGP